MRLWLRRLGYLLLFLLWLLVISLPLLAVLLAIQKEIQIGDDPRSHLRVFLVQEQRSEGIGLEWRRRSDGGGRCSETTLAYLMWEGEGMNTTYCQCYNEAGDVIGSEMTACGVP